MNQSFMLRAAIEQAAAGPEGAKYVAACAAANLAEAARAECASAADNGAQIKVSQFLRVVDGSESWPSVLADLLIESPELATEGNGALCKLIGQKLGVTVDKQRLSRKLPQQARTVVSLKLSNAGYDGAVVKVGTDIKHAVAGVKKSAAIPFAGRTEFLADGVRIDGTKLTYMLRPRASLTGNAWQDFCVKIAGDLVSLKVLLRMRAVSIGEFRSADESALASADPDSLDRRNALQRVSQPTSPCIKQAQTYADELGTAARLWWHELSPTKKATAGFWDMDQYLRSQSADPDTAAYAKRRLDAWAERQATSHAAISQPTKASGEYVEKWDGTLTEIDMYTNPYEDADAFEVDAA